MKVKSITLHNWRSIKDKTIGFQDLMVFIGQNNHGKSNILFSLPLASFLPPTGRITKEIFKQAQEQYIQANKDSITFAHKLEVGPFLGAKTVAEVFSETFTSYHP